MCCYFINDYVFTLSHALGLLSVPGLGPFEARGNINFIDGTQIIDAKIVGGSLAEVTVEAEEITLTSQDDNDGEILFLGEEGVLTNSAEFSYQGDTLFVPALADVLMKGDIDMNSNSILNPKVEGGTIDKVKSPI